MKENVLIALGGNAILKHREEGTAAEQFENVRVTCRHLAEMVREGYRVAVTHGNGPQVGDILLAYELAKGTLPPMPLDVCGAQSQGMIGYMLQHSLQNELHSRDLHIPVATILTRTQVDRDDPAFISPSKPIGPFYTAMEAKRLREENGWAIGNDSGRGFRRLVPSPEPVRILEEKAIKEIYDEGIIVIACGGGGIPVMDSGKGEYIGVEAVIDKDHVAALMGNLIGADTLLILTDVPCVYLHYGKPDQVSLGRLTPHEARKYLHEGQFPSGSMGPKIESALRFIAGGGKRVIISSLESASRAMKEDAGTVISGEDN
ncbi:carbamate kinase [Methanolinea mesophila]|uniref:carbamate kinase n=1 Tax=Methanolinea mesophila TaxID=547055 RepID=UPI001AE575AF|nr:carbamate kinase [Methanolinea mesophila]MBP1929279.1 carbamate kinase [Methanolinea mesophila]